MARFKTYHYDLTHRSVDLVSPLVFPEFTAFSEVFAAMVEFDLMSTPNTAKNPRKPGVEVSRLPYTEVTGNGRHVRGQCDVGPFLSVKALLGGETRYFDVRPSTQVLDYAQKHMLLSCGPISFEAIEREDGVLVIARETRIISGRWLCLLSPATLNEIG